MIKIPKPVMRGIFDHMEQAYPYECCGLMIGTFNGDERLVHTFRKCKNLNTERARDRYDLDPLDMLRTQREFQDGPWDIIGIYHSHPDHPAAPSAFDAEHAWPWYSYLIVRVDHGRAADLASWVLDDEGRLMQSESLEVLSEV